ncbi:hypothetical protein [Methylomonas methanica]|uniref:hypothetical protein n=1 Tax=Methylomonas methanica TaxID=421 RepID=UPI001E537E05|nr:hypothetical protein [Methylomonas methanica]
MIVKDVFAEFLLRQTGQFDQGFVAQPSGWVEQFFPAFFGYGFLGGLAVFLVAVVPFQPGFDSGRNLAN